VFALRNEILFYELWFANCDAYRAGGRQLCQEQGIELDPASGPADHTRKRDATLLLPLRKKMSKNNSPSRRNHDKQMSGRADPLHKPMSLKKLLPSSVPVLHRG
jgi:hypothetical protein